MTTARWMMVAGRAAILAAALACSSMAGNGPDAQSPGQALGNQRPADKQTCQLVTPTVLPDGMQLVDRELVPYAPQLLGVELSYADDDGTRSFHLTIGGYHDELLEAYDELRPVQPVDIEGVTADVFAGSSLDRPVRAALWRRKDLVAPCDARGLVAVGLSAAEFRGVLDVLAAKQ